jgi:ACS family D-galactonate transporter-like MFS transporter
MSAARRWTLLVLLSVAMFVAYVDRINLSVVIAIPDFTTHFGLDPTQRGIVNSAFFWAYALGQFPAGIIVDRVGTKYPLAVCFAIWSFASVATSFAASLEQLFALRLLLGASEAIIVPAAMCWIRMHMTAGERGLATGVFTSGSNLGVMSGVLVTILLVTQLGWQGMFLALGLGSVAWLVPWLVLARHDPASSLASANDPSARRALSVCELARSPAVWGTSLGTFCKSYFGIFCLTWLPSYFVERHGISLQAMSVIVSVSYAGMAATSVAAGYWADRLIRSGRSAVKVHRNLTMLGLVLCITQIGGVFVDSKLAALLFTLAPLAGLGIASVNCWALTQALIPRASIGRVYGIQNFASSLAGVAASIVTGWLLHLTGSYAAPMAAILVVLLIGLASYALLTAERFRLADDAVELPSPA